MTPSAALLYQTHDVRRDALDGECSSIDLRARAVGVRVTDLYKDIVLPLVEYVHDHERRTGRSMFVDVHLDPEIYDMLAAEAAQHGRSVAVLDTTRERMIFPPCFLPHPNVMLSRGHE